MKIKIRYAKVYFNLLIFLFVYLIFQTVTINVTVVIIVVNAISVQIYIELILLIVCVKTDILTLGYNFVRVNIFYISVLIRLVLVIFNKQFVIKNVKNVKLTRTIAQNVSKDLIEINIQNVDVNKDIMKIQSKFA